MNVLEVDGLIWGKRILSKEQKLLIAEFTNTSLH